MKRSDHYFEIADLIGKSLQKELTREESEQLKAWIAESEEHRELWTRLTDPVYLESHLHNWNEGDKDLYWEHLVREVSERRSKRRVMVRKTMRYAAVLLPLIIIAGTAWYVLGHRTGNSVIESTDPLAGVHIMPQGKVAQLVLGNGTIVNLNDSLNEAITEKDGTKVHNGSSALSYISGSLQSSGRAIYNTLITPRGGEYQVILSDGTKVWLNAASTLRYPTQFTGESRKVFLSGEAYFEVVKNSKHPFVVHAGATDITVLGTKFNVSAYPDEVFQKTTLAEGSVQINETGQGSVNNKGVLLKPGFEAVINMGTNNININKANVEAALAWKNGMFIFDSESLGSIMRELARWYDVKVKYDEGVDTSFHFTGRIKRYKNITGILYLVEMTKKVTFSVEGNEVEVSPWREKTKSPETDGK